MTSTSVGKNFLKKGSSVSGQPSVLKGHRFELNQVSNTSGSCVSSRPSYAGNAVGSVNGSSGSGTITAPSSSYQAGIWWPHQSCREMFQGRSLSSQSRFTLV